MAENSGDRDRVRLPKDLTKRPPSRAKGGPDHLRLGKHGVRTTAANEQEAREEAHKQAVSEEYEEGRSTGAGPNPYKTKTVRESLTKKDLDALIKELRNSNVPEHRIVAHLESVRESKATDAEIAVPGETITDSGQKIVLEPDRLDAQEKARLPKAGTPHEEATAKAGKDDLSADKNTGADAPEVAR